MSGAVRKVTPADVFQRPIVGLREQYCCSCHLSFGSWLNWVPTCPKCGGEDVFDKHDHGWPCSNCEEPICDFEGRCDACEAAITTLDGHPPLQVTPAALPKWLREIMAREAEYAQTHGCSKKPNGSSVAAEDRRRLVRELLKLMRVR